MYVSFRQKTVRSFESTVRLLRNIKPDKDLVDVMMQGSFSVIDIWFYSITSTGIQERRNTPLPGSLPSNSGDDFYVYDSLDKVFATSFPKFRAYNRVKASEHTQDIFRKVCRALSEGKRQTVLKEIATVLTFSESAVRALKTVH